MQFVPQTVMAAFIVMWLVCGTTAMGIWWTRRRYRGFGRWLMADLALFVSLVLAVASVIEVATGRPGSATRAAGRWPTGKPNTLGLQDN